MPFAILVRKTRILWSNLIIFKKGNFILIVQKFFFMQWAGHFLLHLESSTRNSIKIWVFVKKSRQNFSNYRHQYRKFLIKLKYQKISLRFFQISLKYIHFFKFSTKSSQIYLHKRVFFQNFSIFLQNMYQINFKILL